MEFITGNKFKSLANYVFDEQGFIKQSNPVNVPIYFVKIDLVNIFYQSYKPSSEFILITHNGDLGVTHEHLLILNDPFLIKWFAQNIHIQHPKLISIPIGIANEIWSHGDINTLDEIRNIDIQKNNLIYTNFDVNTNFTERTKCITAINKHDIRLTPKKPFREYLIDLKSSYFCISPNGNGVDCHKHWESLYLKTIPIVTKSVNSLSYIGLPIFYIDSWESFDPNILTIETYNNIMTNFDINSLDMSYYKNSILINI